MSKAVENTVKTNYGVSNFFDANSALSQPALYCSFFTTLLLGTTQMWTHEFLPLKYIGRRYYGIPVQRAFLVPFALLATSFGGIAEVIASESLLAGHVAGLGLSGVAAVGFSSMYKLSLWFPVLGLMYAMYGWTHHRMWLGVLFDDVPLCTFTDVKEIAYDLYSGESAKLQIERDVEQERLKRDILEQRKVIRVNNDNEILSNLRTATQK